MLICLVPWVAVCIFGRFFIMVIAAALSAAADLLLFIQIWPLRAQITNVAVYGWSGTIAPAIIVIQLYVVHSGADHTGADHQHDLWDKIIGDDSATWQLICSGGVLLLVGFFFTKTGASVIFHSIVGQTEGYQTPQEKKNQSIIKIQSASRRHLSNKVRKNTGLTGTPTDEQHAAATKVQAARRGHAVRKGPMSEAEIKNRESMRQQQRAERAVGAKKTTNHAADVENNLKGVIDTDCSRRKREQEAWFNKQSARLAAETTLYHHQLDADVDHDRLRLPGSPPVPKKGSVAGRRHSVDHFSQGLSNSPSVKPTSLAAPASTKYLAPIPRKKKKAQGPSLADARRARRTSLPTSW